MKPNKQQIRPKGQHANRASGADPRRLARWPAWCLGAVVVAAISAFVVFHQQKRHKSDSLTGSAARPAASAPTNQTAANPAPVTQTVQAVSTNSPLDDPNFKIPDDPVQLVNYGTALLDRGWINEAITLYSKALKQNPDDEEIH